jgi:HAD superfamily phosphatase (TIGR01668 family)
MNMQPGHGFYPSAAYEKLTDIQSKDFQGRPYCIIDVDNTLTLTNSEDILPEIVTFLSELRKQGVLKEICLVSNVIFVSPSRLRRIEAIANQLDASFVVAHGRHSKPHRRPFEQAMEKMSSDPQNTLIIGDQLFTDVRGGNALGIYTVFIEALGPDAWFTRPKRWFERRIRKRFK